MNNNLVTIVALSVDTRQAVLYFQDGSTLNMNQGDARLPGIVKDSKELLAKGLPAVVDITPVHIVRSEFGAAEKGTGGVIKFFRVAKSFLKKLINTESPEAVPEEVAHVSPLSIGVFPGQEKLEDEVQDESQEKALDDADPDALPADLEALRRNQERADDARRMHELEKAAANATNPLPVAEPTNQQKLAAAKERLQAIVGHGHSTDKPEFHTPLDEAKETIVAVHTETGAIVPDAQKLARHLRQSEKLQNYAGFTKFIERLSAIIDQRGHSVEDLMKFIEHGDLPIADDGCIVIYKKLNRAEKGVFVDVHTGRIRQKVGSYVYLLPNLVDPNRRNSCSNGLHVGVMSYVRSFSGNVTIMAKLRPEDVFAVPQYEHTKMRVAGYHIVAELPDRLRQLVDSGTSISADPDGAVLLNNVLRGNHIGISQTVRVGGHQGTDVTYTDVAAALKAIENTPTPFGTAEALNMDEKLEAKLPTAPEVKAEDLVSPKSDVDTLIDQANSDDDEDGELADRCLECGADSSDGEGFDGLCGECADRATAPQQPIDEKSLTSIMSNYPKETSGEDVEVTSKTEGKLSQKEKAAQLYERMTSAMDKDACAAAALELSEFRKSTRKGWTALGLSANTAAEVLDALGSEPKPVNAPKPVKAQSKRPAKVQKTETQGSSDSQTQALTLLGQGLSNIEVARQTGLSKDQVYRLKKKLSQ
ncbi:helix-turn-helix domain-containing protein [Caballeronia sp. TF1N1]|uniref:helix-turn-helix domain-containing protein n=1 Tax=Caballeronia sp. TF1N1 TaxID=2878153 RepID=UPI001FD5B5B1|nr:helix-turn-helix domain-containing protein [Caballeronia sp. TF1N1]